MEELSRDLNRRERWPEKEIDKALLARYRQDESAFTAIYERFTPELLRFIESHLPGVLRAEAEDILHDTFLGLCQRRNELRPDTRLGAFLHTIAERRLTDCIRAATAEKRDYRATVYPDHWNIVDGTQEHDCRMSGQVADPKSEPAVRDAKINADEMLERLSPTEKEAVRLVYLEDHTVPSAATLVNVPDSTIKGRLQWARKHLREMAAT
jgi:RNA polymerase sigma-70 factor (ECF subfamily)